MKLQLLEIENGIVCEMLEGRNFTAIHQALIEENQNQCTYKSLFLDNSRANEILVQTTTHEIESGIETYEYELFIFNKKVVDEYGALNLADNCYDAIGIGDDNQQEQVIEVLGLLDQFAEELFSGLLEDNSPTYPELTEEEKEQKANAGGLRCEEEQGADFDDEDIEVLVGQVEELEQEIAMAQGIIKDLNGKNESLTNINKHLEEENKNLKSEIKRLEEQVQRLVTEKTNEILKSNEKDWKIEELEKQIQELQTNQQTNQQVSNNEDINNKLDDILKAINNSKNEIIETVKKPTIRKSKQIKEEAKEVLNSNVDKKLIGQSVDVNFSGKPYFLVYEMPQGFGGIKSPILLATSTEDTANYFRTDMKDIANGNNFTYARDFGIIGFIVDKNDDAQIKLYNEFIKKYATMFDEDSKKEAPKNVEDVKKVATKDTKKTTNKNVEDVKKVATKDVKKDDVKKEDDKKSSYIERLKQINKNFDAK